MRFGWRTASSTWTASSGCCEEGAEALARGRPADAAALLREALALWRGPPLADVAYEAFAQAEIARLQERRTSRWSSASTPTWRSAATATWWPSSRRWSPEHPLRERLRAQLMVALYRCGRQADALEAYGEARRALLDELGVEPGPALRELQAAILRQDPELAPAPSAWPRPLRSSRRRIALLAAGGALLARRRRGGRAARQRPRRVRGRASGRTSWPRSTPPAGVTNAVDVGPSPSHLAADGQTLWVTNADGRQRLPRRRRRPAAVRQTVTVGSGPAGLAVADGAVWVANSRDGNVSRIDATHEHRRATHHRREQPDRGGCRGRSGVGGQLGRADDHPDRPAQRTPDHDRRARRPHGARRRGGRGVDDELDQPHRLAARPAIRACGPTDPGRRRSQRDCGRARRRLGCQQPRRHRLADQPDHRCRGRDDPGRQRSERNRDRPRRRVGERAVRRRGRPHRPEEQPRGPKRRGGKPADRAGARRREAVGRRPRLRPCPSRRDAACPRLADRLDRPRLGLQHRLDSVRGADRRRPHRRATRCGTRRDTDRPRPGHHAAHATGWRAQLPLRPATRDPLLQRRRRPRRRRPAVVRAALEAAAVHDPDLTGP